MEIVDNLNYITLVIVAAIAGLSLVFETNHKSDEGTLWKRKRLSRWGRIILTLLLISTGVGIVNEYFKGEASAEKSEQNRQLRANVQKLTTDNEELDENVNDLKRRLEEQFQLNQLALMNQTAPQASAIIILRTAQPTNSTVRDHAAEYASYSAQTDAPVPQPRFVREDTRHLPFMDDETGGSSFLGGIEFRLGDLWNANIRVRPSGASSATGHLDTGAETEATLKPTYTISHEGDALRIELSVDGTLPGSLLYSAARQRHPAVTLYRPSTVIAAAERLSKHWRMQITAVELFIALDPRAELWFSIPVRLEKDDASAASRSASRGSRRTMDRTDARSHRPRG